MSLIPEDEVTTLRAALERVSTLIEDVPNLYDESRDEPCTCGEDPEGLCISCNRSIDARHRVYQALTLIDSVSSPALSGAPSVDTPS